MRKDSPFHTGRPLANLLGYPDDLIDQVPEAARGQGKGIYLEDVLIGSKLVPSFIDVTDALPASALGFVPSDFQTALDILEERIEAE